MPRALSFAVIPSMFLEKSRSTIWVSLSIFLFGPVVRSVSLDSYGGSVTAAQYAAEIIAYRKLDTRVARGNECSSACVLLLLAGKRRSVDPTARIGVHTCNDGG